MIGVATLGVIIAGVTEGFRLFRLSSDYRRRAIVVSSRIRTPRRIAATADNFLRRGGSPTDDPDEMEPSLAEIAAFRDKFAARAEYWTRLKQKYERAARYPWLPVKPDPPAPE